MLDPRGDVGGLVLDGREPGGGDVPATGLGARRQRGHRHPGRARQRLGHEVGHLEDRGVVAPARRQREHQRRLGVDEVLAEAVQGGRARATPSVDRLVRVADGGDRHRRAGGDEQRAQQLQLGLGGVLELVEQHRPEACPLGRPDLGHGRGDACRERDLVGEVHGIAAALELVVALDERQHGPPFAQHGDGVADLGREGAPLGDPARDALERRHDVVEVAGHVVDPDEVLGHLAGEVDDGGGHGRLGLLDPVHRAVPGRDGLVRDLPRGRLAEQPALGLDPEPHAVLTHDAPGIRVVGRHGGHVVEHGGAGLVARGPQARLAQRRQAGRQPLGELAGGLAGEGEPEHLVGVHQVVRDQPDHPGGHRLGLARPGPGDHEQRPQRRLDDRHLLGRRRVGLAERSGQLDRAPSHGGRTVGHEQTGCRVVAAHSRLPSA